MVEIRYDESKGQLKLPKNIRQVGKAEEKIKIYVEDYVITFINQLAQTSPMEEKLAILLGYTVNKDDTDYLFIHGAIAVNDVNIQEDHIGFTSGIWSRIYEDIKTYFGNAKVAGWFLTRPGKTLKVTEKIKKIHVDNFPGDGKALFVIDPLDNEEIFFIYRQGELVRQGGYYIFYERNEEMQNYMIEYRSLREAEDVMNQVIIDEPEPSKMPGGEISVKKSGKTLDYSKFVRKMTRYVAVFVVLAAAVSTVAVVQKDKGDGNNGWAMIQETDSAESEILEETAGETMSDEDVLAWTTPETQAESLEETVESTVSVMTSAINGTQYTICTGDTLASISKRFYNSMAYVDSICQLNEINDADKIYPGMTITLP